MTNDKIKMTNKSGNDKSKKYNIKERALEFAARVGILMNRLPKNQAIFQYSKQLIRSSSSVGANLEEADGTLTKKDFINKMAISRRDARESKYWLRLIQKVNLVCILADRGELSELTREAEELMLIISAIINKVKVNNNVK